MVCKLCFLVGPYLMAMAPSLAEPRLLTGRGLVQSSLGLVTFEGFLGCAHPHVLIQQAHVRKRLVLNLPPCHVAAVQQQPADGQLTARGKGLVCDKNEA